MRTQHVCIHTYIQTYKHIHMYTCIHPVYVHPIYAHLCITCTSIMCTPVHTSIISTPVYTCVHTSIISIPVYTCVLCKSIMCTSVDYVYISCTSIMRTSVHTSIISTPVDARSMASCDRVSTDMMAFPPCPAGLVPNTPPHVDSEMATCVWVGVHVGVP